MKKIFMCVVMISVLLGVVVTIPALADNIGYIDMDRLLMNYKQGKTIQEDIQKRREEFQSVFEEKQKQVEKAKKDNKNEKEIQELVEKIEEEIRPKQEELMRHEAEVQRNLLSKIINIAKQVKKEYGIDVVVDKRVVYDGGFDLTDFILDKLNK